jgi:predicted peptidase
MAVVLKSSGSVIEEDRLRRTVRVAFAWLVLLLLAGSTFAKRTETGFLDRMVTIRGSIYKYQVFVPENWSAQRKWPIILFLHGAGERGDDGLLETNVGIGTAIRKDRSRFPALVVMPQCRKGLWWTESSMEEVAIEALAAATKEFHGDLERTYLTGLSMGGYGTWHLAGKYPGRFAAIVPICGGILMADQARQQPESEQTPYVDAARRIGKRTPVWIFHGADDPVVPVSESQRMNEAMKKLGGQVRYTEYAGVQHESWIPAYAEPELMTWMLAKSLTRSRPGK